MLDQYNHHVPVDPPPSQPPAASSPDSSSYSRIEINSVSDSLKNPINLVSGIVLGDSGFNLRSLDLPAPWYYKKFPFLGFSIQICA